MPVRRRRFKFAISGGAKGPLCVDCSCCGCPCAEQPAQWTIDFGLSPTDLIMVFYHWSDISSPDPPPYAMQLFWETITCHLAGSFVLDRVGTTGAQACEWLYTFPNGAPTITFTSGTAQPGGVFDPPGPPSPPAACAYVGENDVGSPTTADYTPLGFVALNLVCTGPSSAHAYWQLQVSTLAHPGLIIPLVNGFWFSDTFSTAYDIPDPVFTSGTAPPVIPCYSCFPLPASISVTR